MVNWRIVQIAVVSFAVSSSAFVSAQPGRATELGGSYREASQTRIERRESTKKEIDPKKSKRLSAAEEKDRAEAEFQRRIRRMETSLCH